MTGRATLRRLTFLCASLGAIACGRGASPPPAAPPRPAPRVAQTPPPAPPPNYGPRPDYRSPRDTAITDADLDALWQRQIMVPVEGIVRAKIRDDFTAKRGATMHRALDLMAARSKPVMATDDIVIGRLETGPVGGIVIYATDPTDRFVYYYAHLERYRRGLAVGDRVAKGSVIGYVGTTGNAPKNAPHLHFQVMKRAAGRAWWDGPSINPLPFFAADGVRP
jgi:peptidoglycan LD-endopeptidase LytH